MQKSCNACKGLFEHVLEAKTNSKASGFMGNRCWQCYLKGARRPPPTAEEMRKKVAEYRKRNPEQFLRYSLDRKFAEIQATPKWADLKLMRTFYERAMAMTISTGVKHAVDHVIPLRHPEVCGLNIPLNLEIRTASENGSKGNNFQRDW